MNFKTPLTVLAAAATVAISGTAIAQYITSTPGSGATATCNTMRGGTGAHRPDPNACAPKAPVRAAAIERIEEPVAIAPAEPEVIASIPPVQEMGAPPAPEEPMVMRPARADRG